MPEPRTRPTRTIATTTPGPAAGGDDAAAAAAPGRSVAWTETVVVEHGPDRPIALPIALLAVAGLGLLWLKAERASGGRAQPPDQGRDETA